jgi:voltage-gated potassium channel
VSNPLHVFWRLVAYGPGEPVRRVRWRVPGSAAQATATIFLILRRMRWPLIALIVIFAVSTFGLTLIPGEDAQGNPTRMGFFHAFYVMSYTATTIGFGELPHPFTDAQRLWVTVIFYLSVVGWAYTIGSLLTLLQDRTFRRALALQTFTRKVARLRDPFLIIAGYGQTGRLLGRTFDSLGRQFVVIDASEETIESLDLDAYQADVPGLAADARNPDHLGIAGLGHFACEAVLAMTNDDEVNLAVAMTVALLRPDLPVVARTVSPSVEHRMRAFGTPTVVNPFDRFGDHLRLALRAPATYQLMMWLLSGPGGKLPHRGRPPTQGRWVLCGYGRFGQKLADDLRAEGLTVTAVDPAADPNGPNMVVGDASDPQVLSRADLRDAVGFVAGTDNDTTNLSLVAAARRINPDLFVAARQNRPANAALFEAMRLDALLVLADVVAHEVYAKLSTPLLWRFLEDVPKQTDDWAARVIDRLRGRCGRELRTLWTQRLSATLSPAVARWLATGEARLGDLLRRPENRDRPLAAVVLLIKRGEDEYVLTPDDDFVLADGDELLLAGEPVARRALDTTLRVEGTLEFVVTGEQTSQSWIWRRLSHRK